MWLSNSAFIWSHTLRELIFADLAQNRKIWQARNVCRPEIVGYSLPSNSKMTEFTSNISKTVRRTWFTNSENFQVVTVVPFWNWLTYNITKQLKNGSPWSRLNGNTSLQSQGLWHIDTHRDSKVLVSLVAQGFTSLQAHLTYQDL